MVVLLLVSLAFIFYPSSTDATNTLVETFRSKLFTLPPGGVYRRFQHIPWVQGHVGIRTFNAEVVDEFGTPVPLTELYLHHWIVQKTYVNSSLTNSEIAENDFFSPNNNVTLVPNSGTCENGLLSQWFGLGSETRKTNVSFPKPYAVESGNPSAIPAGHEEAWFVEIHALDLRNTLNPWDCSECRCDAYNVTKTEGGDPIPEGYIGGLLCCYEGLRCALKPSAKEELRSYYLQYTISYVPFTPCVIPLRIYVLDVTNNGKSPSESDLNSCQIEYDVPKCEGSEAFGCVHTFNQTMVFPDSGKFVTSIGHAHVGSLGMTYWGEDGREICDSTPIYGRGSVAGDESGHVVGMTICQHGLEGHRVRAGEKIKVRSSYLNTELHTGAMGFFYVAVAVDEDYSPPLSGECENDYVGVDITATEFPQIGSALNFLAFGLICFVLGNLVTILFQFARRVVVEKGYNLVASDSK